MSRGIIVVDWLGRGGIAQTAAVWVRALSPHHEVNVITRAGGELDAETSAVLVQRPGGGRMAWHRQLIRRACEEIRQRRPSAVVVHNYLLPLAESSLLRSSRSVGATCILVVHNDRPHDLLPAVGLRRLASGADLLVAHSEYVADRLDHRREIVVLPHPIPLTVVETTGGSAVPAEGASRAIVFGVLASRYKGIRTVEALTRAGVPGWQFRAVGRGADRLPQVHGLTRREGFLDAEELRAELECASVSLFPYRSATQSGGVALSQALGVAPVAAAVGGIPEQIQDDVTGLLVPRGASASLWRDVLASTSAADAARMGAAAKAKMHRDHSLFVRGALEIVNA